MLSTHFDQIEKDIHYKYQETTFFQHLSKMIRDEDNRLRTQELSARRETESHMISPAIQAFDAFPIPSFGAFPSAAGAGPTQAKITESATIPAPKPRSRPTQMQPPYTQPQFAGHTPVDYQSAKFKSTVPPEAKRCTTSQNKYKGLRLIPYTSTPSGCLCCQSKTTSEHHVPRCFFGAPCKCGQYGHTPLFCHQQVNADGKFIVA